MKNFFSNILNKIKNLKFYKKKPFYIVLVAVFSVLLVADLLMLLLVPNTSGIAGFSAAGGVSGDVSSDISNIQGNFDISDLEDMTFSSDDVSDESSSDDTSDDTSEDDASDDTEDDTASDSTTSGGFTQGGTSDISSGSMPDMGTDSSSMPDMDTDSSSVPDMSEMPDGGTFDTDTDLSGDASSDDAASDDTAGTSSDEDLQSAFSSGNETASSGFSFFTFLQRIRAHALLIAIILAVLDIASIVMLIIISKKQKKAAEASLKEQAKEEGRVYIKKQPVQHKHNSKWTLIVAAIVVVVIVFVVKFISTASSSSESAQTEASDLSGTVELTSIDTTLPGAGTLTAEDAVEQTVIDGVEITKWYVSNGDTVEEGNTIAKVDLTSVMTAIVSVQESLEALDTEIAEHEDEEISDTITATAAGRIMAIYAEEDTSVVDTMYESGALVIISIDGLMAVEIETDELTAGDSVTVTLSDGTEEDGKVESVINGTATITISDDGPESGDSVTVYSEDGDELGSGELYIHSELKITGFSGTVEEISVSVGDEVSAGDTLLTLTDTDYTAEYEALVAQRTELEAQLAELFELYATGYIYAETSGVISGISDTTDSDDGDDSDDSDEDDSDSSDSASADTSASAASASLSVSARASASGGVKNGVIALSAAVSETVSEDEETETEDIDTAIGYIVSVSAEDEEYIVTLLTLSGEVQVTISSERIIYTYDGESFVETDAAALSEGSILFYDSDEEQPVYVFSLTTSSDDEETSSDTDGESSQMQEGSYGSESGGTSESTDAGSSDNDSTDTAGDSDMLQSAESTESTESDALQSASDADASASLESAATEETATESTTATTSDAVSTSYSVSESTLFSVTPQDTMTITITIDELDILSIEVGQTAQVTLDALPGQSFEGTVTAVNTSGSNSGGSSKYTAEITIEKNDSMLEGMNASVSIVLETTEDVLVVSADALFEEGSSTYVYTSFDEETGTYGDAVEVTTGISDGTNVEITSGLSEGDTYYYSYLDTVNYTSTTITSGGGLSFDSFMGGF